MAQDCYQVFKTTYNQAIADGFTSSVALQTAGAAQAACLSAQNSPAVGQPGFVTAIPGQRLTDPGPRLGEGTVSVDSRAAKLGQTRK